MTALTGMEWQKLAEEFKPVSFNYGIVTVEFSWEGEGYEGDYWSEDPEDRPLLRFYIKEENDDGELETLEHGSYCTILTVKTPKYLLRTFGNMLSIAAPYKRHIEALTWTSFGDLRVIYMQRRVKQYVEAEGSFCLNPDCKFPNPEAGPVNADGDWVAYDIECSNCGSTWKDVHRLVDVHDLLIKNRGDEGELEQESRV